MFRLIEAIRKIMLIIALLLILVAAFCLLFSYRPAVVVSGSMEPSIMTGSLAIVDIDEKSLESGDIVAFKKADRYIAHRISKVTKKGYITKGDANDSQDPWIVSYESVWGKTVASIPYLGYVVYFFTKGGGKYLTLALVLVLILSAFVEMREGEVNYGRNYCEADQEE